MEQQLNKDFKEFLGLLEKHEVRYMVIGGWAVAFHGHPRYTGDIDIWVNNDSETARKLVAVLEEFGFASTKLNKKDFLKNGAIIQLGYEPLRIDLIVESNLFEQAFPKHKKIRVNGFTIKVVSLTHLLLLKKEANRDIDKADIGKLERVKRKSQKKKKK